MTTTTAPKLTGIHLTDGECDSCGRNLGKVFEVRHPDGTTATYGRRCAAKVTGWKPNRIEAEANAAARRALVEARVATVTAEYPTITHDHALDVAVADAMWNGTARESWRWHTWQEMAEHLAA